MENYSHLQRQTGWSDTIFQAIGSEEEALIYMKAGLVEKTVNGRQALTNPTIDGRAFNCRKEWLKEKLADYDNWKDWNNADLMGEGFPPRDENGDPYELHHIGQRQDSPFAELTYWQHMTDGNNAILHPKRESEIDRQQFDREKSAHWMARFNDFKRLLLTMDLKSFSNNLQKYAGYYNPDSLFEKIKNVARKAGVKLVYIVLLLYYSTLDEELPMKDRLMVIAILGYFILPIDLIPDALPGGFADDMAALVYVLKQVWNNLTPATKQKAQNRLREWFGDISEKDLIIPGL